MMEAISWYLTVIIPHSCDPVLLILAMYTVNAMQIGLRMKLIPGLLHIKIQG